jgi:hypothetical protein
MAEKYILKDQNLDHELYDQEHAEIFLIAVAQCHNLP